MSNFINNMVTDFEGNMFESSTTFEKHSRLGNSGIDKLFDASIKTPN